MRLLSLKSGPEILKLLRSLENDSKAIIEDVATIALYSGQNYNDLWYITPEEKKTLASILEKKIKLEHGINPSKEIKQERI